MKERPHVNTGMEYKEEPSRAPLILGAVIVLTILVAGFLIKTYVIDPRTHTTLHREIIAKVRHDSTREVLEALRRENTAILLSTAWMSGYFAAKTEAWKDRHQIRRKDSLEFTKHY